MAMLRKKPETVDKKPAPKPKAPELTREEKLLAGQYKADELRRRQRRR